MKDLDKNSHNLKSERSYSDINPNVKRVGGTAYIDNETVSAKIKDLNKFLNDLAEKETGKTAMIPRHSSIDELNDVPNNTNQ